MSQAAQDPVQCLGCGRPTDPLRAGHVAILDGRFRYFCDASCKAAYVESSPSAERSFDLTAEPPRVASLTRSARPPGVAPSARPPGVAPSPRDQAVESGPRTRPRTPAAPEVSIDVDDPADDGARRDTDPPSHPTLRSWASTPPLEELAPSAPPPAPASQSAVDEPYLAPSVDYARWAEEEPASLPAPHTQRSLDEPSPASGQVTRAPFARLWLPLAAVVAGAGAFALALAGVPEPRLRAGLVLLGAALLVPWFVRKPRVLGEPSPWIAGAPTLGLVAVAVVAAALRVDQAGGVVSAAGLAVAALVLSQLAALRAEAEVLGYTEELAAHLGGGARRVVGSTTATLPSSDLRLGDRVAVAAGEVLRVDGVVVRGRATVIPWAFAGTEATKAAGDAVLAGLTVLEGELVVEASAVGRERLATRRFAGRETAGLFGLVRVWTPRALPIVCALVGAAEFASNAPWLGVLSAAFAAGTSLSVVGVVATLTLATAATQQDALTAGIAFRDARALELAGMSDVAVLCSRGTVLMGEPEVIAIDPLGARVYDRKRILALAAGAEGSRGTPAGKALLGAAAGEGVVAESLRSVLTHEGLGVTALLANGEPLIVGSRAHLLKERVSVAASEERVRELEAQGASVVLVALSGKLAGLVALQDALRPGARAAIQRLLEARVEPVLVSGETREACDTLARALDIDHVRPEVLPQDRAAEVRALAEGGHVVAVVGRAVADDAALAAADVSIALGSIGLPGDFAVLLATDDVRAAALALSLARSLRERVRRGLVFGVAPTVVAVLGLAFGVIPTPLAPLAGLAAAVLGLLAVRRLSA
ncbi:MAG TPA: HAD-IC family P-type ATPase [Polyangiaceae bacterium]|nr:HAD-IC family P-type ATPase [Polyangiaceae bacterium]